MPEHIWGVEVQLQAFLTPALEMEVSDQIHAPDALPPVPNG